MIVELGSRGYDVSSRALVMGILNRTPDSFYDAGSYWDFDAFLGRAEKLVAEGADLLDVGGVKAGPGPEVTEAEEMDRVVPAIEALHRRFDLPISVDTWRASVARESYAAGAVVGNDISGFADPDFLPAAAEAGASVVACHVRLAPRVADPEPVYGNLMEEVSRFLSERARWAVDAGIPARRVMLDAGHDLGKTPQMSTELLHRAGELVDLGYPVLLSVSNKRFLGELTGTDVGDRREATLAAHTLGIGLGCRILRAHDVVGTRRVADFMSAILQSRGAMA
ncbi:dihydropteroate synthase [Candidatus Poriferisocius sp.]|uniref:dihydropteroate synthase n=1 Tax=Candidatus Poriferisocius sp. TaxID=3101276 RepID=UPI003B01C801